MEIKEIEQRLDGVRKMCVEYIKDILNGRTEVSLEGVYDDGYAYTPSAYFDELDDNSVISFDEEGIILVESDFVGYKDLSVDDLCAFISFLDNIKDKIISSN